MPYLIPITHHISEININKGVYIFLHRASKIPPHIGLIINGTLFEISTNGPGYEQKGIDLLKTAQKRGVEVIFIELVKPQDGLELKQQIIRLVKHYHRVSNEISCLNPIKDFIELSYQIQVKQANFIFELLPILYAHQIVKASFEVNLTHKLIENNFLLKTYTQEDINQCIAAVNRKNKREISI